jgi:hypothetical protein
MMPLMSVLFPTCSAQESKQEIPTKSTTQLRTITNKYNPRLLVLHQRRVSTPQEGVAKIFEFYLRHGSKKKKKKKKKGLGRHKKFLLFGLKRRGLVH